MTKSIIELYKEFKKVEQKGWIKSMRNGTTGIGYTFESLINKNEDSLPIPDYKGIEIKTMRVYSNRKISLFNATPDGEILEPTKRILNILGYPDKKDKKYKSFNMSVDSISFTEIGFYKKMRILVNRNEKKIELYAMDNHGNDLNVNISWSFRLLKEKNSSKLNYLAIVKADNIRSGGIEYFKYNEISFYKLKSFDKFISLIENGTIFITFKIGMFREGNRIGQINSHGISFVIRENDIEKLYYKINNPELS